MLIASNAFLDAYLDPAVRQIVLLVAPAVLGAQGWRESDQSHYLAEVKTAIQESIDAGIIEPQPVDPPAPMILRIIQRGGLADCPCQTQQGPRRQVSEVTNCMLSRLWIGEP